MPQKVLTYLKCDIPYAPHIQYDLNPTEECFINDFPRATEKSNPT